MRYRTWTEVELALLRDMAAQGATWVSIAAALGRSVNGVCNYAKYHGIVRGKLALCDYHRWTPEEDAQLREMVAAGTHLRQIATAMGRTPRAIYTRAARMGLSVMQRGASHPCAKHSDMVYRRAMRLVTHYSVDKVARITKVPVGTVSDWKYRLCRATSNTDTEAQP